MGGWFRTQESLAQCGVFLEEAVWGIVRSIKESRDQVSSLHASQDVVLEASAKSGFSKLPHPIHSQMQAYRILRHFQPLRKTLGIR